MARRPSFELAGQSVLAGRRSRLELPIARLVSGTPVALPVLVVHGKHDGPTVWVSSSLHGDELCGIEIIRRVLDRIDTRTLHGTLIAVPIVNVHGFNTGDRYLPDRRDLNRSFPGSARGSLASRLAHLMMSQIIRRCSAGIDLHTGSDHRYNLPQIRGDLDNPSVLEAARRFAAPISLHARVRDGSLREAATEAGATVLLFEGGQADRFDEGPIAAGAAGVLRVLLGLEMIDAAPRVVRKTRLSRRSKWVRSTKSGILHLDASLGEDVEKGQPIAAVHDPFGKRLGIIKSRASGVVIGYRLHPLVNRGDAVFHVAELSDTKV